MGSINNKKNVPFTLRDASVEGGIYERINSEFTGGVEIGNYHLDNYAGLDTAVLQSPITELWVGGHTHRHVPLNTGNDSAANRPEAWHIEFDNIADPTNPTITFHSYDYLNSPGAFFTREEYVKRPINIKNIRQNSLGNFKHNYEVIQTSGRRISNNLIVDGFVAGGVLTTQFITGSHNYSLPVLDSITGSKSVIVERFNAPGSKEESSRGALDREGEEMSPNISLPWRNYKIRKPFYSQLSQSTPQFGISLHGVYRNTLPGSGSRNDESDNGFITRPVPRTDIHYSWITASSTTTAGELGGYQSTYYGESDISFISGSEIIVDSTKYIIDNLGISSLIKDKKQVDLDSKLLSYSSDVGLSASFGELTRTPYSFTTWTSIRTGEHPISRGLRKNNIISIQQRLKPEDIKTAKLPYDGVEYNNFRKTKRSSTSLNFTEPAVTFKYKPLKTRVRLAGAPEGSEQVIVHTFTNNIGNFANKDLRIETGLQEKERSEQFYDFLKLTYDEAGATGNPIAEFLGYQYSEVVWPREENTGLSKTRKREAYILDQPGFDRDGYDRQLGTQRVFWRDNQEDRRRSKNSEGGYYSSMNYLSTEETGSNFVQYEEGVLSDNKFVTFSSSFVTSSGLDSGLFNSFVSLENLSSERNLYSYSSSIESEYFGNNYIKKINYNSVYKRGFSYENTGEFNNNYIDFYEQFYQSNGIKKSIGSLYRNTNYKFLLTCLSENRESLENIIVKVEDEEIITNPKLKYITFIGGAELNTGSFVQSQNFSSTVSGTVALFNNYVYSNLIKSGSDLYVGGAFSENGGISANGIAKWNIVANTWTALGTGLNGTAISIEFSGSDLYVGGSFTTAGGSSANRIAKWDTTTNTWSSLGTGLNGTVNSIIFSGSDLYVGGAFTTAGGSSANRIAKWNTITNTWSALGTGLNGTVNSIIFSGSDLYVGGSFTTAGGSSANRIAKWDTTTNTWSALGTGLDNSISSNMTISGSDLYVGGAFQNAGGVAARGVAKWNTSTNTWSSVSSGGTVGTVYSMSLSGSDLYVSGIFKSVYSPTIDAIRIVKLNTITNLWSNVGSSSLGLSERATGFLFDNNNMYVGGFFFRAGGVASPYIVRYDLLEDTWNPLIQNPEYSNFPNTFFQQTFNTEDILFSTMDNGLLNNKKESSSKEIFYDSYEKFNENTKILNKEFSVIPEFIISNNIKYYVSQKNSNFRTENRSFLQIDGKETSYSISQNSTASYDQVFIKSYLTSDLKINDPSKQENKVNLDKISVNIQGIKKLLPYNGFFPQDRTVQISNLYSEYLSENLHGGTYSLTYQSDYYNDSVIFPTRTGSSIPTSISVCKFGKKYVMAVGYSTLGTGGEVDIYNSNTENDPTSWSSTPVATVTGSVISSASDFGKKVQILSASNGLNLFISGDLTSSLGRPGYIFNSYSDDGVTWGPAEPLKVHNSSPEIYLSGSSNDSEFGFFYDILYDKNETEKIIIGIGSYAGDTGAGDGGEVYIATASMGNNGWEWSDKTLIYTGSANWNEAGTGISIISCSSGYQMFFGETAGDLPTADAGNLLYSTSSNGIDWRVPVVIASGSYGPFGSSLGYNNIKSVDFNNKTYVFWSEPGINVGTGEVAGGVFFITSSTSNQWPTSTSYLDKKLLYTKEMYDDNTLNVDRSYSIEIFSGSDERLYYSFVNEKKSQSDYPEFISGYIDKEGNYQTYEAENIYRYIPDIITAGGNRIAVAPYELGGFSLPIFFFDVRDQDDTKYEIRAIKNNLFTDFTLRVSGSDKFYKHAALEPFMAPGILYNTIKSGIAVDWPCATGSNTAIQPYGANTIVNAYYPKAFEMASYSGSNIYESLYGHLRSNIDYRVPFENIIFPGEAFPVKDFLQEDLTSRTVLTTLPDTDPLVEFINGTYIYGGYEPYISPVDFSDINNLGPKRFSVPFVYRKAGSQDSGLYTLAMSNFLAETVKFFLKDEKMTTFVSDPDYKWKEFNQNKTYYMDIVLEKSPDLVMMEAYHSDLHPTGSNGEKMNGRYFGYPINKTDKEIWGDTDFTAEEKKLIHNDPAYAPYTPPYFEGVARARISFKPLVSGKFTLQEIFDNATVENIFVDIAKGATTGSDAYVNAMPINSSIDIFGSAQSVEVTIDETTGEQTVRELQDSQNWIISPRMETPVLDFSSQSLTPYENNYSKTGGFGRGMWSGYGSVPVNGKGIKIRLEDPFATKPSPNTGSLLNQIGLKPEERNVGSLADNKLISEAVVVIPYLDQTTRNAEYSTSRKNKTDFEFIKISKKLFNKQLSNYRQGKPAISPGDMSNIQLESPIQDTSITEMIEKMERYVIPPEMNFLEYKDIDPFVMYIAEFEHVLDQEDLKDIWQGLMPKISYTAETDSVTVSHDSAPYEFFEGKEIPENLRWMVFKIKRKAEYNYFNVTATTKDDNRFNFNKIIGRKEGTDIYSYNWPYDFFSLVEFGKVELQLDYKKKEE